MALPANILCTNMRLGMRGGHINLSTLYRVQSIRMCISLRLLIRQQFGIEGASALNLGGGCLEREDAAATANSSGLNLLILSCRNSADHGVQPIRCKIRFS